MSTLFVYAQEIVTRACKCKNICKLFHTQIDTCAPAFFVQIATAGTEGVSQEEEAPVPAAAPRRLRRIDFKAFVSFCAFAFFDRLSTGM